MTEIQRIQDQLRRAIEGGAWHGPALLEILGDLEADKAARRPFMIVHSPAEIATHVLTWLEIVIRRLDGEPAEPLPAEDWPLTAEPSEAEWASLRDRIVEAHQEIQSRIGQLRSVDLDAFVPGQQYDVYFMLHGVIQHCLYHAGQLAILKKAIGVSG